MSEAKREQDDGGVVGRDDAGRRGEEEERQTKHLLRIHYTLNEYIFVI